MPTALSFTAYPRAGGPFGYALVPWDAEIFGFPVYELRITETRAGEILTALREWLASLPAHDDCLVYSKVATGQVALWGAVAACGFYPVETILDLSKRLDRESPPAAWFHDRLVLRPATAADLPAIAAIARDAFRTDRFHLDPNLDPERADERYERWARRGFDDGEIVLALEDRQAQRLVGFYQLREIAPETVDLALLAIEPRGQRSGLGAEMSRAAFELCRAHGYQAIVTRVSTNNLASVNLHIRLGFSVVTAAMTLHWFRRRNRAQS